MPALTIQYHRGGVHLPRLGLWLDAHARQTGPERVFVSHAHSDHARAHREIISSAPTARLMQARIGGQRLEHILPFHDTRAFGGGEFPYRITLLPAGHILGSAMSLVEAEGRSLLYTGDFKLRRSLSAEPCAPSAARGVDVLIMETTFGRPEYQFPPAEAVLREVIHFCHEAIEEGKTALLLGYSLGKSQELLRGLAEAGLPIMLHGTIARLTQIYEQFGQQFPPYELYDPARVRGKVLLCPPGAANSLWPRNSGETRTAVLTGWAIDASCRFRYQCDAAFPLSDHADFHDLVGMVEAVMPKKILTLHGFAADFAATLRDLGFDARSLSEDEQLTLPLKLGPNSASANARLRRESKLFLPASKAPPATARPTATLHDDRTAPQQRGLAFGGDA